MQQNIKYFTFFTLARTLRLERHQAAVMNNQACSFLHALNLEYVWIISMWVKGLSARMIAEETGTSAWNSVPVDTTTAETRDCEDPTLQ